MKDFLARRIEHASTRIAQIKESHGETPHETYNYYGGQSLGQWEGKLSAYQNMLDKLETNES